MTHVEQYKQHVASSAAVRAGGLVLRRLWVEFDILENHIRSLCSQISGLLDTQGTRSGVLRRRVKLSSLISSFHKTVEDILVLDPDCKEEPCCSRRSIMAALGTVQQQDKRCTGAEPPPACCTAQVTCGVVPKRLVFITKANILKL